MSKECKHGGYIKTVDYCNECGSDYETELWVSWYQTYRDEADRLDRRECLQCGQVHKYNTMEIMSDTMARRLEKQLFEGYDPYGPQFMTGLKDTVV